MKITSSKKDDLIRQRDEWESNYKQKKDQYDEQHRAWQRAYREVCNNIETTLSEELKRFAPNVFNVSATMSFHRGSEVRIRCNDDHRREGFALSWNFDVELDEEGNVKKESGSWSGLNAVTQEQLTDLEASVRALRFLNEYDWAPLLNTPLPKTEDYITEENPDYTLRRERPDFEYDIASELIDEIVGERKAVAGKAAGSLAYDYDYRGGNTGYYIIVSTTPKLCKVIYTPDRTIELYENGRMENSLREYWDSRLTHPEYYQVGIRKSTLSKALDVDNVIDI